MRTFVIPLLFLSFVFFYSCKEKTIQHSEKQETLKVKVQKVEEIKYFKNINCIGRISSEDELKLSFKTGGIIQQINVIEGQKVKKGEVLAKLNLKEINAMVDQAKLGLEKAMRDFQRVENLYNDSVATLEQYQNMKSALELAKTNVEIANFNLNYSVIKAPNNGIILKQLAEENEMIAPGFPVFLFGSNEKNWIVKTNVTDKQVIDLSLGDKAKIYTDAYPDTMFIANISEIGSFADPYTGTFEVGLQINNTYLKLISGLIVSVEIIPKNYDSVIKVPYSSLLEADENIGYIYKLKNKLPVKQKIHIHKILDDYILISKGLEHGDTIITEGINYIKPGQVIEIVN